MRDKFEFTNDLPILVIEWTPSIYLRPFHWHTALEVAYCISGRGHFYFSDKCYKVMPGDVFVVNNMERHIAQADADDPCRFLFLIFDPAHMKHETEVLQPFAYNPKRFDNQIPGYLPAAQQIGMLIREIQLETQEQNEAYKGIMHSALLKLCYLLQRHYKQGTSCKEIKHDCVSSYKIQPALNYVKENFREPITLEDVANVINLSLSRTRHLFKESTGEGFKEYLTQIRVNEAKRMLVSTNLCVVDICLHCGFQSMTPFYRAFKQIVGVTPQEYRIQKSVLAVLPVN